MARLYTKKVWVNDQTKLSAKNLNHIENGIEAVANSLAEVQEASVDAVTEATAANNKATQALENITEAVEAAANAVASATLADEKASQALDSAIEAKEAADNAVALAVSTNEKATQVFDDVIEAKEKANQALDGIAEAIEASASAVASATSANEKADQALQEATSANEKATRALQETTSNKTDIENLTAAFNNFMITFVGTRAEYEAANGAGRIPSGVLVIITDEEEEIPGSSATTAKLGTATLGSMILGQA